MYQTSLIYKFLVLHLMLNHMEGLVQRLDLPPTGVRHPRELVEWGVISTWSSNSVDAYLRTTNLHFGVNLSMGLNVCRLSPQGYEDWPDPTGREPVPASSVDTNQAYQVARICLEAAGVDVAGLETKYPLTITQRKSGSDEPSLVSPRFTVTWGARQYRYRADWTNRVDAARVLLDAHKRKWVSFSIADVAFYRPGVPRVANGPGIAILPDEPVKALLAKPGMDYRNTFALLKAPPGYQEDGLRLLLAEAKEIQARLNLSELGDLREERLVEGYANPPAFGAGGLLVFPEGKLRFDPHGKLSELDCPLAGNPNYAELEATLKATAGCISADEALDIALSSLRALSIDVARLDREHAQHCEMGRYRERREGEVHFAETSSYCVWWGNDLREAVATAGVYGHLRKVHQLELRDTSYWLRPPVLVTNSPGRLASP